MAAGASPSPFTPAPALASSMAALPPLAPMPAASPAPSSSPSLGFDGGDPVAAGTDGAGSGEGGRRVDAGSDGGGEPQPCKDGGSQPHPATDGDGGKKPQCNRRKNLKESSLVDTIIKEKNQKVVKANDKIEKKVLPLKEKNQKVVKANEKIEKNVEKKASQKQVGAGKLPQVGADKLPANPSEPIKQRSKKREANIRNIKSASPRVSSPVQVTSSPGVNYLVRAAAVKKEALKRSNMGGSPSTPQRPSQNQLSPSLQALSPDTRATISKASNRKRRKLISDIWTEAEPIYNNEGKLVEGICIHCGVKFAASRESGTSHMRRHLKVCEAKTSMDEMVAKMGRPDGLDPDWKFNPNLARRKLLKMIVINEMPFSLVEYRAFREFTRALNPWFENISRTTIKNDCVDAFKYHGDEMKEEFEYIASRISLTGDMWTSNQKLGYFCLTAHFITDAWKLHKYIIRFAMMETPHNSVNSLRTNLKNKGFLVLGGKLLHFRCATHVFNLIVQDGLKVINSIVNNIRESVKYVRSSQSRVDKFVAMIIQEGLSAKYPCPDVTSRWNSTFLMLQSALPLRNAFLSLETQDKEYTFAPLNSEWELAEAVMKVLEVFYTATNTLSGSKYPTSHLYFYQLWSIKNVLNREESILNRKFLKKDASGQDIKVAHMIAQMQTKFNQYWKETYMSACIPVILDPRYKYDLVEYLLSDFGTEKEADTWMGEVKKTMEELFSEYNKEFGEGESQRDTATEEVQDDGDPLARWDRYVRSKRQRSSNELERYLKEQLTPRKEEVDILHWWKTKSELYPVLSRIARDVLAIPASTVPSESAFSTGGRVISDYRTSLTRTTVEALICLQDWFKAAEARKDEEEE